MKKNKMQKTLTVLFVVMLFWAIWFVGALGFLAIKKAQPNKPFEATYTISNR